MIRHRTKRQVRFLDIFKLVIAIILILLLLYLWFWRTGAGQPSVATTAEQSTATPTEPAAQEEVAPTETPVPEESQAADTPEPVPTATPAPVGPTLDLPSGELTTGQVALSGAGEPGSAIEIVANGEVVGTATVGSDGRWSFTADLSQAGDYSLTVRSMGADGSIMAESEPAPLSLTAPPVAAPTVDLPPDSLAAGAVELTGAAEPGSTVEIVVDGEVIGTVTAGSDGAWSFTADLPDAGDYELSVRTVAADGSILAESDPMRLPLSAPEMAAPTLDLPAGDLAAGEVELTGAGAPGSEVQIVLDGEVIGTATVDSDGSWSFTADLPEAGDYQLAIRALDATGAVVAESMTLSLAVTERMAAVSESAGPTAEVGGQAYLVQADDWLSKLADKFYGDMFAYPAIVEATNAKAVEDDTFTVIDNPDLIEIGQKLWIPDKGAVESK